MYRLLLFIACSFVLISHSHAQVDPSIQQVHLVYMTHLDVGFTNFARNVCELYFFSHFPAAINTSNVLRARGGPEKFVYTSHPWLILEFLDGAANCTPIRPTAAEIQAVEAAIIRGDITWHAKPWNELCEGMSPALFSYGLTLSKILDKRFNVSTKIAASSKDVPGVSKAVVPLLAEAGIKALHIGVNPECTPPNVPNAFMWQSGGAELLTFVHAWFPIYGGTIIIPGFPYALVYNFTIDNSDPQTAEYVLQIWADLRAQYPNAEIIASSVDAFATLVLAKWKDKLPIITQEMGNTWLYGSPADPFKVSVFREISRYLGPNPVDNPPGYLRRLMKNPEHNWGLSVGEYLTPDHHTNHWSNAEWYPLMDSADYQLLVSGWDEARSFLFPTGSGNITGSNSVDRALKDDTVWQTLGEDLREKISNLIPDKQKLINVKKYSQDVKMLDLNFESDMFYIGFDATTGAINNLVFKPTKQVWADPEHLIGKVTYQTYSMQDFNNYNTLYNPICGIPCSDFSKPGMQEANPIHNNWQPELRSFINSTDEFNNTQFLLELQFPETVISYYGCPANFLVTITLPKGESVVLIEVDWYNKPPTRLAEAIWMSFTPNVPDPNNWAMDVLGQLIQPLDVVNNGSRHSHFIWSGVKYLAANQTSPLLSIDSLDAGLVSPGDIDHLIVFDNSQPNMEGGMHFNLFNNLWGTAFPQWYSDDAKFRFAFDISGK